jgi:serine/threonine protein kinase
MTLALAGFIDIDPIGRGGIGDVYGATCAATGAQVAVKVLRDVSDGSAAWRRARRELEALVSLAGHPHVVQVHDVRELDGHPALVMERLPGGSGADLLARRTEDALAPAEAILVGVHAARALAAAHERGIVHRDVKPHNLLVDAEGRVKLCDFGVAALARSGDLRDRTAALSTRYASPEDLDGAADRDDRDHAVGPPSDIYSLGATLLHLAHGAPPTLRDRLIAWTPTDARDPARTPLDEVIARCLRPAPEERPTAAAVVAELERLADRTGAPPTLPTDPSPARAPDHDGLDLTAAAGRHRTDPARPAIRSPRRWPAVAGAAVAALAVVAAARFGGASPDAELAPTGSTSQGPSTAPFAPTARHVPPPHRLLDRPPGLVPLTGTIWPSGPVGECLAQVPGVQALQPIGCDRPHDLQRIGAGTTGSGPFSGIDAAVESACAEHLRSLGWPDALPAGAAVASTRPSARSFAAGDRAYQCLVGVPGRRSIGELVPGAGDGGRDGAVGSRS